MRIGIGVVVDIGDDVARRGLQADVARARSGRRLGVRMTRKPNCSAMSPVPSVDPSSTTMTSKSG